MYDLYTAITILVTVPTIFSVIHPENERCPLPTPQVAPPAYALHHLVIRHDGYAILGNRYKTCWYPILFLSPVVIASLVIETCKTFSESGKFYEKTSFL